MTTKFLLAACYVVLLQLIMKHEVLAPKWIFRYFQFLGLHSSGNKFASFCYQAFLSIILIANWTVWIKLELEDEAVTSFQELVSVLESISDN